MKIDNSTALIDWTRNMINVDDSTRARSIQKEIGASEIGGCQRKLWHKLNGDRGTNPTYKLQGFMGTAAHASIEHAIKKVDPFGDWQTEIEVSREDLRGHVDAYNPQQSLVIDWKTTAKKNLRYFPKQEHIWQVHLYAWMLGGVDRVGVVMLPRDASEAHIAAHLQDYDESVTAEALDWWHDVRDATDEPAPGMKGVICTDYCPFYGSHCWGKF
jgi:hypothetical protein